MMDKIKNFYFNSIKRRLIITVTLTHVLLMSIFVYDLISEEKDFLEKQTIEQVKNLTQTIAKNSVSWVLSNDLVALEELISSLSKYPNLEYAMILNKDIKVLAHSNKEYLNHYLSDKLSLDSLFKGKVEPHMIIENTQIIDFVVPIFMNEYHIGWVRVALNQKQGLEALRSIFYKGIFFVFVAILIGYLFSYLLAKNITKDLYNLISVTKNTATGNRKERVDIIRKDELGILSEEVNKMLDKIEENENKLELSNQNLEKKVAEKTFELRKLNENLKQEIKEEVEQNRQKDNMLFQQAKMASMGEMIENIAHQWRQPLSFISTSASGIKLNNEYKTLSDELLNEALDNIMNSTQFLSNTIDDFRDFYKVDKIKIKFNIKEMLHRTLKLTSSRFTNRAIKVIEDCDDLTIFGYGNELVQVFINILNNARDELEKLPFDERYIFITVSKDENNVLISIKDNAGGIDKNILEDIFNPYFTTKSDKKGTGIGLFMSKEIIEKHFNGNIYVKNETFIYNEKEYIGANFIINIPL